MKKSEDKSKCAPKRIAVDWNKVESYLIRKLNQEEIAAKLGISVDTLDRRFKEEKIHEFADYAEYARKYRVSGDADYKIVQYDEAIIKRKEKSLLHGYRHRLGEWDYRPEEKESPSQKIIDPQHRVMQLEYLLEKQAKEIQELKDSVNKS